MQTPAHLAASLFIWQREPGWIAASAVTLGAIIPDLPMFGFYAYQKSIGSSERDIWGTHYFEDHWQYFFDLFNSIPIAVFLIGIFYFLGIRWGVLFAASALVHLLFDLPLHHDDAHRHFLPIVQWRFESPVSYWDPKHFGHIVAVVELVCAVAACLWVGIKGKQKPMRIMSFLTLGIYILGIVFAVIMWGQFVSETGG